MSKPYSGPWVIRTLLFVAGHIDRHIEKAFASHADCLVLDLEDAVPESKKEKARRLITSKVGDYRGRHIPVFVRVNSRESGMTLNDLESVACEEVDGFILPKIYRADDVIWFEVQLARKEKDLGLPAGHFDVIALMETPEAIQKAHEIAYASSRIIGLLFGHADFLVMMRGSKGSDARGILVPRYLVSMAARAAGIIPIDTFYPSVHDDEGLRNHISLAQVFGYEGMLLMSPSQIDIARERYTPSHGQVLEARNMLALKSKAESLERAIMEIDGVFISPPGVRDARKLIERFDAIEAFEAQRG